MRRALPAPVGWVLAALFVLWAVPQYAGTARDDSAARASILYECRTLRQAIEDLATTFGARYPNATDYLERLDTLQAGLAQGESADSREPLARSDDASLRRRLDRLKREALLANPLLEFDRILVVRRKVDGRLNLSSQSFRNPGLPSNHECNSSLPRTGYDNEIAVFSLTQPQAGLATVYRPSHDGYPYSENDGRSDLAPGLKVVRGGSFFDRPERCRSAFRLAYPSWRRVFNVGFRVVAEIDTNTDNCLVVLTEQSPALVGDQSDR